MKYILMVAAFLLLAGCGGNDENNEVVVVGNDTGPESETTGSEEDESAVQNIADDYMGEWTMVIDGRLKNINYMTIDISENQITETHVDSGQVSGHNSKIFLDTLELADS